MTTKKKSVIVGLCILLAYGVIATMVTESKLIIFTSEIISGLAYAVIALVLGPLFKAHNKKLNNYFYYPRLFEGGMILIIGIMVLFTGSFFETARFYLYEVQTYLFMFTAFISYILFYQSKLIPRFISIWGMIAILLLFINTILNLFGFVVPFGIFFLLPIVANEFFLAGWLIIKGMKTS